MPFTEQQTKDDVSKHEIKSGPCSPFGKIASSSNLFDQISTPSSPVPSSSHIHSHNDVDDDDELPSFTPSLRPATTTQSSGSNSFLSSQTSGFQSDSGSPQFGSQIFSGFQSQSSYMSEAGSSEIMSEDHSQADDDDMPDELPDDDFPPAPTLIRQTGYYKASTSHSCSCLEPEERTDADSYIYSR